MGNSSPPSTKPVEVDAKTLAKYEAWGKRDMSAFPDGYYQKEEDINDPTKKLKRLRPLKFSQSSKKDLIRYREHYPGKTEDTKKIKNLQFYKNEIECEPEGAKIDVIHEEWFGNYELLENHHGYIQWIFPIREFGMNMHSQELQLHEIEGIIANPACLTRVQKSYELMLNFYGMRLINEETGALARANNYEERYKILNKSFHNYLRITRMLKCLGELGFEHYKVAFVEFTMKEACEARVLTSVIDSLLDFWVETIYSQDQRDRILEYADRYIEDGRESK